MTADQDDMIHEWLDEAADTIAELLTALEDTLWFLDRTAFENPYEACVLKERLQSLVKKYRGEEDE